MKDPAEALVAAASWSAQVDLPDPGGPAIKTELPSGTESPVVPGSIVASTGSARIPA